jgi:hypothetical protein
MILGVLPIIFEILPLTLGVLPMSLGVLPMTLGVSGSTPNDSRSTPHDIGSTPHDNGWEHFQGLGVLPVSLGKHRRWKPESPKARTKMAPKCNQKEAPDIIMTFRSSFCYRARNGVNMAPGRFIVRPCRAMLGGRGRDEGLLFARQECLSCVLNSKRQNTQTWTRKP